MARKQASIKRSGKKGKAATGVAAYKPKSTKAGEKTGQSSKQRSADALVQRPTKDPNAARQAIYRHAGHHHFHAWPPSYTWEDFSAIVLSNEALTFDAVLAEAPNFDRAAAWFHSDRARPRLSPPSIMKPRIRKSMERADALLEILGVESRADAEDCPVDDELWAFLTSTSLTEDELRLLCQLAAKLSYVAEHEFMAAAMAIYPDGHTGNEPLQNWIGEILSIAVRLLGNRPGVSVAPSTSKNPGGVSGPFVRFLKSAGKPLNIQKTDKSWRKYIREAKGPNRS